MSKTLIILSGPTASGKSQLAFELASKFQTSIVSADSRQVYQRLDIGTAKPDPWMLERVPHYLIGHVGIECKYSVGQYLTDANGILKELFQKNDLVFLTGGTGFYVKALMEGLDPFPEIDSSVLFHLNERMKVEGVGHLSDELQKLDPEYAAKVDLRNPQRLIRALSVIHSTGRTFSSFLKAKTVTPDFNIVHFLMEQKRELLYERINKRVEMMIDRGLLDETSRLEKYWNHSSMNTVGYSEIIKHLKGEWTLDEAIVKIKQHTRNYAKRQLTWYRKYHHGPVLSGDYFQTSLREIEKIV
ncbi:MAG: tRNA (adenosine(37)-N6)-dimethylallyltransferase MiaA [Saprospiraceae bacterium]|nr:tRNA (adenosine(37)-N6)-dimethylallyltransferase MiaA [Saprospiraceae bacterium]